MSHAEKDALIQALWTQMQNLTARVAVFGSVTAKWALQIVYSQLCAPAVRWPSKSSTATPAIRRRWRAQIDKLKQRFGLNHVVLVGDAA